jgi:hypothetical protein
VCPWAAGWMHCFCSHSNSSMLIHPARGCKGPRAIQAPVRRLWERCVGLRPVAG